MKTKFDAILKADFETRVSISEATGLGIPEIQYISEEFIPPLSGGGRRGVKLKYSKKAKVEFAITKRLMDYSITIKNISQVFKFLRKVNIWDRLFNDKGILTNKKILGGGGRVYLYINDADPKNVGIVFQDADDKHLFELKDKFRDMLIVDITDEVLLAKP